ncbi:MAG: cysteine desulfurase-like protein [Anaerolineales bacterium]|nr:cysteine desulfurase-like protein [Anaerolineales bacterium]
MTIDLQSVRAQFPSLNRPAIFFDNPGGTQIARQALERMNAYLLEHNANHDGAFATSRASDAVLAETHAAMADLLHAASPDEIVFGANMTTLTLHVSRSLARNWQPGDCIVVTRLDHDANVTPWVLAAEDHGCEVLRVDFHPDDGTLDMEGMQKALERKPRLVAVGYASNALGTINPVAEIVRMAHAAGSLVYVDAVQYAPHGGIDVQALACDFLVASAYKFFGPHVGALYGRYALLDELFAYKVRPASNTPPGKFETGTLNHEGLAGVLGAVEYLEWLGTSFGAALTPEGGTKYQGRALRLKQAMAAIQAHELELSRALLEILEETPGVTLYGLRDAARLEQRVPTYAFRLQGWPPRRVAEALDQAGIYVWDGNYYALSVTERLGVEASGGMVRVGPVHYNTVEEVWKFGETLGRLAAGKR